MFARRATTLLILSSILLITAGFHTGIHLAPSSAFRLPVLPGVTVKVTQGNNQGDHKATFESEYAYDFAVINQTNFVIAAAQGGQVIEFNDSSIIQCDQLDEESYPEQKPLNKCWAYANFVLIANDDGKTASLYAHLLPYSNGKSMPKVSCGEHVNQGDPIGLAGTTGFSIGVHLHFQVESLPTSTSIANCQQSSPSSGWWWTNSLPVTFSNPEVLAKDACLSIASNGILQTRQCFVVSNPPTMTPIQTLSAYCNAQKNGDSQSFFNLLSHRIQVHVSPAVLAALMYQSLFDNAHTTAISSCKVESVTVSKDGNTALGVIVYTMANGKVLRFDQPLVRENGVWKVESDKATLASQTSTPTPPVPVPTPTPSFGVYVGESWKGTYTPPCQGTTCSGNTNPATLTIQSTQLKGQSESTFTGTLYISIYPHSVSGTVGSSLSDFSSNEQSLLQAAIATTDISSTQAYIVFSDQYGTLFAAVQDQHGDCQGIVELKGLVGGSLALKKN